MTNSRGFSLVELMIAGTTAAIVVFFAFMTIGSVQGAAATQQRGIELVSRGRLALEVIGRDIRSAGDAVQILPFHCITGFQAGGTPDGCAAILDPHPWRITLARNAWVTPSGQPAGTAADGLSTAPFDSDPNNVVTYQFVPRAELPASAGFTGVLGRIERIQNPFSFGGEAPRTTVLVENVLLDERMRVDPATNAADSRYDFALFLYQVMSSRSDEYLGDPDIVARPTTTSAFLLPPMRFFAIPSPGTGLPAPNMVPPYLPDYGGSEIVGLYTDDAVSPTLFQVSTGFDRDLRYVLDYNRIRTVRVAFKVLDEREDPEYAGGIELDPSSPGTAHVLPMEATFELKVFSSLL